MKILITGSNGFIGKNLLPYLKQYGVPITLIYDLRDYEYVKNQVLDIQPDIVIHLAARTEVQESFVEQVTFSEINYVGTVNLIESCKLCKKTPFFLFASTMEVYGWQPISDKIKSNESFVNIAFDENTTPNPNAPYAVAKYACEKYLEYANRAYGLPYVALRQTNSYGRNDNNYFVTEQIITQMLKSKLVKLGYPEPYRNFIYIDDLIDVYLKIIENYHKFNKEVFTIGPDDPRKISDCVDLIANKLNFNGNVMYYTKPPRPGEIYWLNSNHNKLTKMTGWQPKISYSEGIDRTIELWRTQIT